MGNLIQSISKTVGYNRKKNKLPYADYILSFDIETTKWETYSTMYCWTLGGCEYSKLIRCKSNDDLESVVDIVFGRNFAEFDDILYKVNEAAENNDVLLYILIYNLSYEWSYLQRNIAFIVNNYDSDYPTVIEGRHNIMSIKAGNLVFLDAQRLFALGSLRQNAAKYGFEKLEYDYDVKRHTQTALSDYDRKYNVNDVLITLGSWAKCLHMNGYEHVNGCPITNTLMIKDILRRNENVNKVSGYREHKKHDTKKGRVQREELRLFDGAVNCAANVVEDIEHIAPVLEATFCGGYSHCNMFVQGKLLFNVGSFDLGSAYPAAMQAEWYPTKLIKKKASLQALNRLLEHKKSIDLAKYTRSKLKTFFITLIVLKDVNVKVYSDKIGSFTMPLISRHKIVKMSDDAKFDNGKLIHASEIRIYCTNIDLMTWEHCYNFDIISCEELYVGGGIRRLPQYWLNAVEYCYKAKTILKKVYNLYKNHDDNWKCEYLKLDGIDNVEINHVLSMEYHDACYYLDMVLHQRKGELNGLYGIMVMHIIRQTYTYNSDKDIIPGETTVKKSKDGTCYIWGIIITAIVRLWEVCFSIYLFDNGSLPAYWDTDSVKAVLMNNDRNIVNKYNKLVGNMNNKYPALGAYDDEAVYIAFKSLGSKRYIICEHNKSKLEWESTIAGLPKRVYSQFLTAELSKACEYLDEKEAIEYTAGLFRPNVYIDESATDKLIPKYYNVDAPVDVTCTDVNGVTITEHVWPGAVLGGIQFAIMDLSSINNRRYQELCDKFKEVVDDYSPITIYRKDGTYVVVDGSLKTPKLTGYMAQKDMVLYS